MRALELIENAALLVALVALANVVAPLFGY